MRVTPAIVAGILALSANAQTTRDIDSAAESAAAEITAAISSAIAANDAAASANEAFASSNEAALSSAQAAASQTGGSVTSGPTPTHSPTPEESAQAAAVQCVEDCK